MQQNIDQSQPVKTENISLSSFAFSVGDQSFKVDPNEGLITEPSQEKAVNDDDLLNLEALPKIPPVDLFQDQTFEIGVSSPEAIAELKINTQYDVMLKFTTEMAGEFPGRREFFVSSAVPVDLRIPAEYVSIDSESGSMFLTQDFNTTLANGIIHCTIDGDSSPQIARFDDAPVVLAEGTVYSADQYTKIARDIEPAAAEADFQIAV